MVTLSEREPAASQRTDPLALSERLAQFADETERSGLPWAAAHIRNVARMVIAERDLAAALGN